nr:MAG TPA: hypothetical protein [Caudoviricetes sp.]
MSLPFHSVVLHFLEFNLALITPFSIQNSFISPSKWYLSHT